MAEIIRRIKANYKPTRASVRTRLYRAPVTPGEKIKRKAAAVRSAAVALKIHLALKARSRRTVAAKQNLGSRRRGSKAVRLPYGDYEWSGLGFEQFTAFQDVPSKRPIVAGGRRSDAGAALQAGGSPQSSSADSAVTSVTSTPRAPKFNLSDAGDEKPGFPFPSSPPPANHALLGVRGTDPAFAVFAASPASSNLGLLATPRSPAAALWSPPPLGLQPSLLRCASSVFNKRQPPSESPLTARAASFSREDSVGSFSPGDAGLGTPSPGGRTRRVAGIRRSPRVVELLSPTVLCPVPPKKKRKHSRAAAAVAAAAGKSAVPARSVVCPRDSDEESRGSQEAPNTPLKQAAAAAALAPPRGISGAAQVRNFVVASFLALVPPDEATEAQRRLMLEVHELLRKSEAASTTPRTPKTPHRGGVLVSFGAPPPSPPPPRSPRGAPLQCRGPRSSSRGSRSEPPRVRFAGKGARPPALLPVADRCLSPAAAAAKRPRPFAFPCSPASPLSTTLIYSRIQSMADQLGMPRGSEGAGCYYQLAAAPAKSEKEPGAKKGTMDRLKALREGAGLPEFKASVRAMLSARRARAQVGKFDWKRHRLDGTGGSDEKSEKCRSARDERDREWTRQLACGLLRHEEAVDAALVWKGSSGVVTRTGFLRYLWTVAAAHAAFATRLSGGHAPAAAVRRRLSVDTLHTDNSSCGDSQSSDSPPPPAPALPPALRAPSPDSAPKPPLLVPCPGGSLVAAPARRKVHLSIAANPSFLAPPAPSRGCDGEDTTPLFATMMSPAVMWAEAQGSSFSAKLLSFAASRAVSSLLVRHPPGRARWRKLAHVMRIPLRYIKRRRAAEMVRGFIFGRTTPPVLRLAVNAYRKKLRACQCLALSWLFAHRQRKAWVTKQWVAAESAFLRRQHQFELRLLRFNPSPKGAAASPSRLSVTLTRAHPAPPPAYHQAPAHLRRPGEAVRVLSGQRYVRVSRETLPTTAKPRTASPPAPRRPRAAEARRADAPPGSFRKHASVSLVAQVTPGYGSLHPRRESTDDAASEGVSSRTTTLSDHGCSPVVRPAAPEGGDRRRTTSVSEQELPPGGKKETTRLSAAPQPPTAAPAPCLETPAAHCSSLTEAEADIRKRLLVGTGQRDDPGGVPCFPAPAAKGSLAHVGIRAVEPCARVAPDVRARLLTDMLREQAHAFSDTVSEHLRRLRMQTGARRPPWRPLSLPRQALDDAVLQARVEYCSMVEFEVRGQMYADARAFQLRQFVVFRNELRQAEEAVFDDGECPVPPEMPRPSFLLVHTADVWLAWLLAKRVRTAQKSNVTLDRQAEACD
ncbi:hypothetical protein DIPPA_23974 [Diplonema papillatum]|nr:hypothetical protein DIPPA_23974 [Diplonema papillatum]